MAKAIHWPKGFEQTVQSEGTESLHCALRPGALYFENRYWVEGEVVDIRVNHEVVRKAVVIGELKCCPIKDLTEKDLKTHKPGLQSVEDIVCHLKERYQQDISPESLVTVVYYKNLELAVELA